MKSIRVLAIKAGLLSDSEVFVDTAVLNNHWVECTSKLGALVEVRPRAWKYGLYEYEFRYLMDVRKWTPFTKEMFDRWRSGDSKPDCHWLPYANSIEEAMEKLNNE